MRVYQDSSVQPGRPREFDEEKVLLEIMQLFWRYGYEGTGLSEILKATGLGKASLYAAYGNKHSIYLRALGHYEALMVNGAVDALRDKSRPALSRLDTFLSSPIAAVKSGDRRGCFLCNASSDRASFDEETSELVRRGYAKMRDALEQAVREVSDAHTTRSAKGGAQLALTVYAGLRTMARSGIESSVLATAKTACLKALKNP